MVSHNRLPGTSFFILASLIGAAIPFLVYILTLAPTVTFEDSGELIAAAYTLGVPHQPGYPLFTLLGHLFTFLPLGNVAYRLNLMSAVCTAAGVSLLVAALILLLEDLPTGASRTSTPELTRRWPVGAGIAGILGGLLGAVAFETWEQSIITEVYGLNTLFVGALILSAVLWRRAKTPGERTRYFLLICYLLGLTLANHTTSLMFIPILLGFALTEEPGFFLSLRRWMTGLGLLLLGLAPYLYLPLASARDPWMDWGDPETLTNFIRTVTRHQYGLPEGQTWGKFWAELGAYGELLWQQWWGTPVVLLLALVGLIALFRRRRSYGVLCLLFFIFAGPVTTYVTHFDVTMADSFAVAENKALVSVFYIPSYLCLGMLAGAGMFELWRRMRAPAMQYILAGLLGVLVVGSGVHNYRQLDMSRYTFTEDYVHNLFTVVPENGVVFANWDPYYFPLNYYQFVEHRRRDIIALDQQLLRRSWYIQWLKDHYPEFVAPALPEIEAFLKAVAPFENRQPYDGNYIQQCYIGMINALIDRALEAGRAVYFTYVPTPDILRRRALESVVAAFRLKEPGAPLDPAPLEQLRFRHFFDEAVPLDRMARVFRSYYGRLMFARGEQHAMRQQWEPARALFLQAMRFLQDDPTAVQRVRIALSTLEYLRKSPSDDSPPR